MKCENVIQKYLNEDDGRYPSLFVRLHMAVCPVCRQEIRDLQKVFAEARTNAPFKTSRDMSDLVMLKIMATDVIYEKNVSSFKWIFTFVILLSSILTISYSDSFIWLKEQFGSSIDISLYIVLGFAITLYSASLIGTHIDSLKKFAEFINHKMH